jgi:phosphatidylglycerophosphatase A
VNSSTPNPASDRAPILRPGVNFMLSHPAHFLSLGMGSGLSRIVPGTVGTLFGWLLFHALSVRWPEIMTPTTWAWIIIIGFIVGVWACNKTGHALGVLDHGAMVWDEIIAMYRSIIKIDPYHAIANYRLALIYYNRSDFGNSWKYLKNYINVYPFDFDGNSLAGWIKYSVGKKEEAIVFFRKALLVNPYDTSFNKVVGTNK